MLVVYLLGFPFVVLWVIAQLTHAHEDDLFVFLVVAVVYALIWPVALPIDLGSWFRKNLKKYLARHPGSVY